MLYLAAKAALSGLIIAIVSPVADIRRAPLFRCPWSRSWASFGCGMIPRHRTDRDVCTVDVLVRAADIADVLLMPAMLRHGIGFWSTLAACCALTFVLYLGTIWTLRKFGLTL